MKLRQGKFRLDFRKRFISERASQKRGHSTKPIRGDGRLDDALSQMV